jgi:membrane-associated phospholipid phosphatase
LAEWILGALIFAGASGISAAFYPYCRSFDWNDATISQPHKPNTFPTWSLAPVMALPCVVFALVVFFCPQAPTLLAVAAGGARTAGPAGDGTVGSTGSMASSVAPSGATVVEIGNTPTGAAAYGGAGTVTFGTGDETASGSGRDGAVFASPECGATCCGGGDGSSRFSRAFWMELNALCLTQLQAVAIAFLICEPLKVFDGRLRPDFISRLAAHGITLATFGANRSTYELCEGAYRGIADLKEGRKSFPSGHSLSAFVGVTPLALYLLSRTAAWSRGSLLRLVAVCGPLYALAFIIAATRTRDDWHHHSDILAGGIIGFLGGVVGFHLNFARWGSVGGGVDSGFGPSLSPLSFAFHGADFSSASLIWHLARHSSERASPGGDQHDVNRSMVNLQQPRGNAANAPPPSAGAGSRRSASSRSGVAAASAPLTLWGVEPHEADYVPRAVIRMLDWRYTSTVMADAVAQQHQRRVQ